MSLRHHRQSLVIAALLVSFAASHAIAAPISYSFVYSGLREDVSGSFAALGLTDADILGFTITLDASASPRTITDLSTTDPAFSSVIVRAAYDYDALEFSVDGLSFAGPSAPQQNSFFVQDGEDGTRDTFDDIDLIATTDVAGPNGTLIEFASFSLNNFDETGLSSVKAPTLDELQAVRAGGLFGARLEFSLEGQSYAVSTLWSEGGGLAISQNNLVSVPLPGGTALLLIGLGALGIRLRSRIADPIT